MRVCLVSHRLGGFDGVSVEAAKWVAGFRGLGCRVTRAAGFFADREAGDVVVAGLWADRPGGVPPPVDHDVIRRLCGGHDLLVLDNAGSLWSAPAASAAWQRHAVAAGVATIVRHHDPAWQGAPLRTVEAGIVPLRHSGHLHVVINRRTEVEFGRRWPELVEAGALVLVHNRVEVDNPAAGDRDPTRKALGVEPGELLILHPARVEAANKNIPGAVRFARALAGEARRPVRYWLTDPTGAEPGPVAEALEHAPGLVRGQVPRRSDMYAAADLVVLPSTWEGWGLPVVEAAAAGKPIVAGPYPVLDEIRALGVRVFDPTEVAPVAEALAGAAAGPMLEANRRAVRDHLDIKELPNILSRLVERATSLSERKANAAGFGAHPGASRPG